MIAMKWARFDGNRVIETTEVDPKGRFHHSLRWAVVPADVTPNSVRDGLNWSIVKWDADDFWRVRILQANIAGLQDDASAADRLADYKRELVEVQARIDEARESFLASIAEGVSE